LFVETLSTGQKIKPPLKPLFLGGGAQPHHPKIRVLLVFVLYIGRNIKMKASGRFIFYACVPLQLLNGVRQNVHFLKNCSSFSQEESYYLYTDFPNYEYPYEERLGKIRKG
jgi:hypothetical protein